MVKIKTHNLQFALLFRNMGELGAKLGLDELTGGAAGISRALLAEFIGNY